jgi:hypothetical protein
MWDGSVEVDCAPVRLQIPARDGFPKVDIWVRGNLWVDYSVADPDRSVGETRRYCDDWGVSGGRVSTLEHSLKDPENEEGDEVEWVEFKTPTAGEVMRALLRENSVKIGDAIDRAIDGDDISIYGRRAAMRWHSEGCP